MAAFDENEVISDPDQLAYQVNPASYKAGTEEILIDTTAKTVALKVVGNLKIHGASIKAVYSKLKDAWRADSTLIKFPFPMGPITDEQFEMINGWNWDKVGSTSISINAATYNGGLDQITFTTTAAHGISVGDIITVAGVTPSTYNGTYVTVAGTTGSTIVVGSVTVDPGSYTSSGTVSNYLTTPYLIRTGGWSVVDISNNTNELWMSAITLGTLGNTDQVYYQQLNSSESSVDFKLTGKVNQAIQIYFYDGSGTRPSTEAVSDATGVDGTSFVLRRYLKLFVREWQKIYAQSAIADIGVSQLTYQAYRFPLTNTTDLKVTHTEEFVNLGAAISTISGNGTTTTVTTSVDHGLAQGDFVDITGTVAFNGRYQVSTITSSTVFTFLSAVNSSESVGYARRAVYSEVTITYLRDANDAIYDVRGPWVNGTNYAVGDVVRDDTTALPYRWYAAINAITPSTTAPNLDGSNWVPYVGERLIGTSYYAFTVIIDADNGVDATLSGAARTTDIYEIVQYKLRQNADTDQDSTFSVIGKTADSLLRFVGDTLVTSSGVYIDSFNESDTNLIQFVDYSGTARTFPFTATLTVNFGNNLQNDQYSKYWVFFTSDTSIGSFGTATAVIVKDKDGVDMAGNVNPAWPTKRAAVTHTYNYDSNDQRGGGTYNDGVGTPTDTAGTDAPVTVVAIGLSTGQYVSATSTIGRNTANAVTLTASLERNYSQGTVYP